MQLNDERATDWTHADERVLRDELFHQLALTDRRHILSELLAAGPGAELDYEELLGDPLSERDRIALYHKHLPSLAAVDIVEWDRQAEVVSRGPRFDRIESLVELAVDDEQ